MASPEEEFAELPEDMTLGQWIKQRLQEDYDKMHMDAFGIHPGECIHCINRDPDVPA